MDPKHRIVTQLPLQELWNAQGAIVATRERFLGRSDLSKLLTQGVVQFIVADVGRALDWVPVVDHAVFWKGEARPHLVDDPEKPFSVFSFLEGYAYVASEWMADGIAHPIVVLERHH